MPADADKPTVRITDVAKAAGVSPATVSRVFNRPDLVAEDKRDRVLAAVSRLNYAPNSLAHGLRAGHVKQIALLVGDISQPFSGAMARAVSQRGEQLGYRVLLYNLDHREDRLVSILGGLRPSETSGTIIATANDLTTAPVREAVAAAQARGVRVVTTSQIVSDTVPAALPRYQAISHLATAHLATQGLWPIVFIGGDASSPLTRERRIGFERACTELGLNDFARWCFDTPPGFAATYSLVDDLLKAVGDRRLFQPGRPFGVLTLTVLMAQAVLQAAREHGLRAPEDFQLICFENLQVAAEWHPSISTVAASFEATAEAAFQVLLAGDSAPSVTHVPHRLILRATSSPAGGTSGG